VEHLAADKKGYGSSCEKKAKWGKHLIRKNARGGIVTSVMSRRTVKKTDEQPVVTQQHAKMKGGGEKRGGEDLQRGSRENLDDIFIGEFSGGSRQ